jgi:hypothetical protein
MSNQKITFLVGGALIVGIVIGVGVGGSSPENKTTIQESVVTQETTPPSPIFSPATETSIHQSPSPVAKTITTKPSPVSQSAASYNTVFTFSGDGAKKSEPFSITGSRFKIKYNCSGDICQAFLYKSGGSMSGLIMNKAGSTSDETIFYGAGQYYIDANTMGSYSMTVEDYK